MKIDFFANFRGKLGAIQHERAQSAPSLGIKRPHKNNQKYPKMQKSSRLKLHAGSTPNTKRRVWNSTFNALFSKMNLHSKSLFVTPPICLYNRLHSDFVIGQLFFFALTSTSKVETPLSRRKERRAAQPSSYPKPSWTTEQLSKATQLSKTLT